MTITSLTPGSDGERRRGDGCLEPELDLVVGQAPERLDAVHGDQAAVPDDRDPVAGPLDLTQDVRREERGASLRDDLANELEEGLLDQRVEPGRRLVEDQQVGPVLERDDQAHLLLVALGVLPEAAGWVEVEAGDEVGLVARVDAASEVAEVLDRLGAREPVEERELAGEVADPPMDGDRVRRRLDAEDQRAPGRRTQQVEQEPDRRRLAGAVGPEEPVDLAFLDGEIHLHDAAVWSVELGELLGLDDGHRAALPMGLRIREPSHLTGAARPWLGLQDSSS